MSTTQPDDHEADPGQPAAEPTYSVAVGARVLRKSERWYYRQLRAGALPGHRAGRTWFLTASDIAAALELTRTPQAHADAPDAGGAPADRRSRRRTRPGTRRRRRIPPQS
ncbi:helix-turn-helix domain-containing protein [Nocardia wallacei]|uniref:helix-turn-helix domain-containing protein n=1 Tax=Nocardia wallacei TaxID=480035 RepID=UPI0024556302|nr:helix-turn-helix domain-containing protein [Nocardia wallacei]